MSFVVKAGDAIYPHDHSRRYDGKSNAKKLDEKETEGPDLTLRDEAETRHAMWHTLHNRLESVQAALLHLEQAWRTLAGLALHLANGGEAAEAEQASRLQGNWYDATALPEATCLPDGNRWVNLATTGVFAPFEPDTAAEGSSLHKRVEARSKLAKQWYEIALLTAMQFQVTMENMAAAEGVPHVRSLKEAASQLASWRQQVSGHTMDALSIQLGDSERMLRNIAEHLNDPNS